MSFRSIFSLISTTAFLALVSSTASADSIVIDADQDTTIYADNTNFSNGAGDFFFAGRNGGSSSRRGLISFDLSAIPTNAVINSATLTMFMSQSNAGNADVSLHLVTTDWGESTSDAMGGEGGGIAAEPGDATWVDNFFPGSQWTIAGGDFIAGASATTVVGGVGSYDWTTNLLAADIQAQVNGSVDNFGWIVIGNESTAATAKRFNSRSNGSNSPFLTIEFTSVPEPSSLVIAALAATTGLSRRRRQIRGK